MNWNQALFPSLKRRGGCAIKKMSRSNLSSRRRGGAKRSPIGRSLKKRSAKSLGLKSFAELTTPSAAFRRLRAFLLMPQPPLLFKEGNVSALKQSVNSFTRSDAQGCGPSSEFKCFLAPEGFLLAFSLSGMEAKIS